MSEREDLATAISGMAPSLAESMASGDHLFRQPEFSFEVKSTLKIPGVDKMNGTVVMRFPNLGDDLEIERLTRIMGGGHVAHMTATLAVCITKAPASWYEVPEDIKKKPVLHLERLLDDSVLADLYAAFTQWQRSFR